MDFGSLPAAARRHPAVTFGLAGGSFALLFVLAASTRELVDGDYVPSGPEAGLVGGGFVGGVLLARLLWGRLDATRTPLRGAAVGALIELLALPVPMHLLELDAVALEDYSPTEDTTRRSLGRYIEA